MEEDKKVGPCPGISKLGTRRWWTQREVDHLRERVAIDTIVQIASDLDRSPEAVGNKLSGLGLYKMRRPSSHQPPKPWNPEDDAYVIANRGKLPVRRIANDLGRTGSSITSRVRKLGLDDLRRWTSEEDQVLLENYEFNPGLQALLPGRSWNAIVLRANRFGQYRRAGEANVNYLFFDDPWNRINARVLGFFIADGWLDKRQNHVSFSQADPEPLRRLLELMACGSRIQQKKGRKEWVVDIYNGRLADRLAELRFDNKKSSTAEIPEEIPLAVYPDLLGGIHEGDGSVYLEVNPNYPERVCGVVQFLGTECVLNVIREYLVSIGMSPHVHVRPHGKVRTFALKYKAQVDVVDLIRLLYPDDCTWLTKKRNEALAVFDRVVANISTPRKRNRRWFRRPPAEG